MATPLFSISITPGTPEDLLFTDLSTSLSGSVTKRRIYIQKSDGNFLVTSGNSNDYESWNDYPTTTTKTLSDILDKDYGCRVTVEWLDVSNTVLYDKTLYYGFTGFNEDFDYTLTQLIASNPLLMNDNNYWQNKSLLRTLIDSGDNAIERASDITSAQQCYDLATQLRLESVYYFNGSE